MRHWLGFARVAELGSVRKAADAIGIAQPALTGLLADLESLIGAPLFERHARGMRLTALGRELLPTARRVLGAIDDAAQQAASLQANAQHVMRVGAIAGAVGGLLAPVLPALARKHPELLVQLIEAEPAQLDQLVARQEIDVALCRTPAQIPQGWNFVPLLPDRFIIVAGRGHALAKRRRLEIEDLRAQVWLAMPGGSPASARLDSLFADGEPPPMCQVSSRIPTILWAMLRAQPLLALVPASVVRPLIMAGELVQLRFEHNLDMDPIGALCRHGEDRAGILRLLAALKPALSR
ncbi:LysR family transcriptional regulator [Ideonella sp. DXS29W]|uniref:LysR family transcriptional regulator n=1 Tax=Ideonella lacteola TaxID=2984193 RepID=A0ABU9BWD8_9BURK